MEENYINIFSKFLAGLLDEHKLEVKDVYFLTTEFIPVCEQIRSREDLAEFVAKYENRYWELKALKKQLLDKNFIFQ